MDIWIYGYMVIAFFTQTIPNTAAVKNIRTSSTFHKIQNRKSFYMAQMHYKT